MHNPLTRINTSSVERPLLVYAVSLIRTGTGELQFAIEILSFGFQRTASIEGLGMRVNVIGGWLPVSGDMTQSYLTTAFTLP